MNKGWECPKCGNVYAPHIDGCNNCNDKTKELLDKMNEVANVKVKWPNIYCTFCKKEHHHMIYCERNRFGI